MNYIQTHDDLMKIFIGKYVSLISSCKLFDQGHIHEAKEMAVKIRTLLHDTSSSTSILSHLKKKSKIIFINTGDIYDVDNLIATHSLVSLRFDEGTWTMRAVLNSRNHITMTPFHKWWEEVILSNTEYTLTRKELILGMSDKDGGAHVDKHLKIPYAKISKKGVGWKIWNQSLMSVELYSVRQIAHEILLTLGAEFTELERYLNEYNKYIINKVNWESKSIEYEIEAEKQLQLWNLQETIDYCDKSLKENQLNFNAMRIKQVAMWQLGRLKELLEFIEECLLLNPENIVFLNNLSYTNFQLKDYKKVLEITEKILHIEPENISNFNIRAISYAETGDTERAKITLMKGFNLDPNNVEILKNLCYLSRITNDVLELKKFTDILNKVLANNNNSLDSINSWPLKNSSSTQ